MDAIAKLIRPRSIAVVGASADAQKLTGRPVAYLQRHGYDGEIYPINPRSHEIAGLVCYPDAASLPTPPDVAIVLLGSDRVLDAVAQLSQAGCPAAIVLASGFGETGEDGRRRQQALKTAAGSMRLLGPNTIGLVNLTDRIMLSASGAMELDEFPVGAIALVSQSGGILGSLLSRAVGRGIGFSKLIATGNEADLDVADFVDYLVDDPDTAVIALYLEAIRRPDAFRNAALRAARAGKPIVAFKVGRSESGIRSAVSHTGALAGADRVYDAFFRQLGVVRAQTFADLLDIPAALSQGRHLKGRRVAIVTSTGGAATLVADSAGLLGFDTPAPDQATAQALTALDIHDAVLDRNPIDVTLAGLRPDLLESVIDALFESPTYDAVVVIVGSSALGQPDLVAKPVIAALARTDKPLLAYVSPEAPHIVRHLNRNGVPAFVAPESVASALAVMMDATQPRPSTPSAVRGSIAVPDDLAAAKGALNEADSKRLFACFGIPPVHELVVEDAAGAVRAARTLGNKVVVKVLSRHILHKTEVGGVAVGVSTNDVAGRCEEIAAAIARAGSHRPEGFLVQEMVSGVEMILGCHRDPQLGPVILLGTGGVTAELMKDTAIRLAPVTLAEARSMIGELKASALLAGFRGRPPCDVTALAQAVVSLSEMVMTLGDKLIDAEINPLFVLSDGQGVCAADGLILLSDQ